MRPRFWLGLTVAAALVAFARAPAWAQTAAAAPQLRTQVDTDTVGVGEVVQVELQATTPDAMPGAPQLGNAAGFTVRAQSASPSQTHININGNRMDRYTLTVDWVLQAERVGTFKIGPPSVTVNGTRFSSRPVTVRVVPPGQAPPRRTQPQAPQSPFGFSPFDPWRQLIPGGFDPNDRSPVAPSPTITTDPKLALDAPRGGTYFLHATVDKSACAVGEQVTLSVYEYIDATAPGPEAEGDDVHEPPVADFAKHPLLRDDQEAPLAGFASVGGRPWQVRLARRWALFPLRAGDLVIGPMSLTVVRPAAMAGQQRTTETFHVRVSEPPPAGRPPGYALGDVGHFALTAQVQPREIEAGGAIGVHVELSGTGNLPSALRPPAREGVEWLAPETHDELGAIGHESYGGKRSFDFVVRLKRAGDISLGDLTLPFWDPEQSIRDRVAQLGAIHVTPSATATSGDQDKEAEILAGLPAAHVVLEGLEATRRHADDTALFWLAGVAGCPLAFAFAFVGRDTARRVSRVVRNRRASPGAELRDRLSAARAACGGSDARAADSAISRALEAATVAHAGVNVRGAVGDEVTERLERAGVEHQAASSLAELLRECEIARFAPDAAELGAARNRWTRAQAAIRSLERRG